MRAGCPRPARILRALPTVPSSKSQSALHDRDRAGSPHAALRKCSTSLRESVHPNVTHQLAGLLRPRLDDRDRARTSPAATQPRWCLRRAANLQVKKSGLPPDRLAIAGDPRPPKPRYAAAVRKSCARSESAAHAPVPRLLRPELPLRKVHATRRLRMLA